MTEFRLVVQAEQQHLHGDYSGTERRYVLQYRFIEDFFDPPWRTLPVVNFDQLTDAEQCEIRTAVAKSWL